MRVYPDYYMDFRCLASDCRHSCCANWEIDIDRQTLARYRRLRGALGQRLRAHIARRPTPHFRLSEGERCPFLRQDGLCELILERGDESLLCQICREHPRFRREFAGREELGLGLCCEAAGRLILGRSEPMRLVAERGVYRPSDESAARDALLALLQARELPLPERLARAHERFDLRRERVDVCAWAQRLLRLERMDEAWTARLEDLLQGERDEAGFERYMAARQAEYEQLLVYLIYRHAPCGAAVETALAACLCFVERSYALLRALGARAWTKDGIFDLDGQVELARLFSSEIEYSDENSAILLDECLEWVYALGKK